MRSVHVSSNHADDVEGFTNAANPTKVSAGSHREAIRILIAHPRPILCSGLAALLNSQADFKVVGMAGDCVDWCRQSPLHGSDILVCYPDARTCDKSELLAVFRNAFPAVRTILLHDDVRHWRDMGAMGTGVGGHLTTETNPNELFRAIRVVNRGGSFLAPAVQARIMAMLENRDEVGQATQLSILTDRERTVLQCLVEGKSNQQIADELCVSKGTVKHYVSRLLTNLHAANRTQVVKIALELGLL